MVILILYVDDMILTRPHLEKIAEFKQDLQKPFAMTDLSQLHYFLGIQFARTERHIDAELRYDIYEKELLAIIHALKIWKHYILRVNFVVQTNRQSVRYFQSLNNPGNTHHLRHSLS